MCGIYGFTSPRENAKQVLTQMGNLQKHRGPDGEGNFIDDNVALGMRRLSIIDIAHGNQPFFNNSNNVIVFCNGEIYNYIELRAELSKLGYRFETNSDIEVIPHLYTEFGIEFIQKLNGMYSIVIYDKSNYEIYLIRDRLGVKPLYYSVVNNKMVFSSELKSMFSVESVTKEIDFNSISLYLELNYIPTPFTPYKNISKLPSGTYLHWNSKGHEIIPYWDLDLPHETLSDGSLVMENIDSLLKDSMRMQVRSDVPVGGFLSGGIDSSLVTALASSQVESGLSTFHLHWKNVHGKIDEKEYAESISKRYGKKHFIKDISDEDLINVIPKLIWHLDEPFADGAFVFTYALALLASKDVKVILSGAGGDELFGGYDHYNTNIGIKSILSNVFLLNNPFKSFYGNRSPRNILYLSKLFKWYDKPKYIEIMDEIYKKNKTRNGINAQMLADIRWYLQDNILFLTDKMTMAASIECRVPILDHRLVEYSLNIDSSLKISDSTRKLVLCRYAEKYLPKDVIYREKEGFGAPIGLWVNKNKRSIFDSVVQNGWLVKERMINRVMLDKLIKKEKLNGFESWVYWRILILEIWLQVFIEEKPHEDIFNS